MQTALKSVAITATVIKIIFIIFALNRFSILSVNAIPTKIATWIAHIIIADIHNYHRQILICQYLLYLILLYKTKKTSLSTRSIFVTVCFLRYKSIINTINALKSLFFFAGAVPYTVHIKASVFLKLKCGVALKPVLFLIIELAQRGVGAVAGRLKITQKDSLVF